MIITLINCSTTEASARGRDLRRGIASVSLLNYLILIQYEGMRYALHFSRVKARVRVRVSVYGYVIVIRYLRWLEVSLLPSPTGHRIAAPSNTAG